MAKKSPISGSSQDWRDKEVRYAKPYEISVNPEVKQGQKQKVFTISWIILLIAVFFISYFFFKELIYRIIFM